MSSYTQTTMATSISTSSTIPEIIEDNVDFLVDEDEELITEEELQSGKSNGQRFVIKFINAIDIPAANDFRSKVDPFLRAHICVHQSHTSTKDHRKIFKLKRISEYVTTPRRSDCNSAVWNSYRDFRMNPPMESILTVECLQAISDPNKPHVLLGKVDIPIASLNDDSVKTFYFVPYKVSYVRQYLVVILLHRLVCPCFSLPLTLSLVLSLSLVLFLVLYLLIPRVIVKKIRNFQSICNVFGLMQNHQRSKRFS